ncbi:hypothetical protein [Halosolutus halophilus]|nr:hypothetical protein [Halosolutus halophilus]
MTDRNASLDATGCLKCGTTMTAAGDRLTCPACGWGERAGAD